jgi:hypothetical protein
LDSEEYSRQAGHPRTLRLHVCAKFPQKRAELPCRRLEEVIYDECNPALQRIRLVEAPGSNGDCLGRLALNLSAARGWYNLKIKWDTVDFPVR